MLLRYGLLLYTLLLGIFYCSHFHPGDSPQIISVHTTPQGEKHVDYIKTGDTVSIFCNAVGESPLKYTWLLGGETLPAYAQWLRFEHNI